MAEQGRPQDRLAPITNAAGKDNGPASPAIRAAEIDLKLTTVVEKERSRLAALVRRSIAAVGARPHRNAERDK
jgi:hypothetical protein